MKKGSIWKIVLGSVAAFIGVILIALTFYTRQPHTYTVIGGADGPTALFLAGKVSLGSLAAGLIIGTVLFVAGVLCIIRYNQEK